MGDSALATGAGLTTDQTGAPRIYGTVDIGSYELQEPANLVVSTLVDEDDGDYTPGDLSLREAISLVTSGRRLITFDPALTAHGDAVIDLTLSLWDQYENNALTIDKFMIIEGPAGPYGITIRRPSTAANFRLFHVTNRGDLTLQNLQARVRSPSAWMLANLDGSILLSTSNRSEAAVGYTTMDGDTSGGLSPIAGVDKTFVRAWLRWLETTGPEGFDPLACLAEVTAQAPTAELRPPEASQKDEEDLMPYVVLDAIEELAIRDRLAPEPVLEALIGRFPELERADLVEYVRRFFRLWVRNQWKRERLAPSFHLDDENLDPKTWCRYPILGGDWGEELAALEGES